MNLFGLFFFLYSLSTNTLLLLLSSFYPLPLPPLFLPFLITMDMETAFAVSAVFPATMPTHHFMLIEEDGFVWWIFKATMAEAKKLMITRQGGTSIMKLQIPRIKLDGADGYFTAFQKPVNEYLQFPQARQMFFPGFDWTIPSVIRDAINQLLPEDEASMFYGELLVAIPDSKNKPLEACYPFKTSLVHVGSATSAAAAAAPEVKQEIDVNLNPFIRALVEFVKDHMPIVPQRAQGININFVSDLSTLAVDIQPKAQ